MKRGLLVLLLVVVAVLLLGIWAGTRPEATLEVVRLRSAPIRAFVEEQAVTELPFDHLVSMPIDGWLEPVALREGDRVEEGQVLARLETDDLDDRVRQAEARVAALEAAIAATEDDRLENNALVEMEAVVKAMDETVRASEAKLGAGRALLDFAREELELRRAMRAEDAISEQLVREADLDFRQARALLEGDTFDLAAMKTVHAVSYIGPKFVRDWMDREDFTLERQRRELLEARTELEIERRNRARAEIRSPIAGVVLERRETRRQFLRAGTPLLVLGRLEELEVVAEVLTERATRIATGMPVEVFGGALPEGPLAGEVARVFPAGFRKISALGVEQQRVKVAVKLADRPERLGTGYRVRVRIIHDRVESARILPRSAVYRAPDGGWRVLVVEEGRLAARGIELGLLNDDAVQVLGGLEPEDRVVRRPASELREGMRVAIAEE